MRTDARGNPVTGADGATLEAYEKALRAFQSYVGDPVATIDAALADAPAFVNGHLLKTFALYTLGERQFVPMAKASLAAAQAHAGAGARPGAGTHRGRRAPAGRAVGRGVHSRSTTCSRPIRATRSRCRPGT